jgi:hypothetical protein
MLDDSHILIVNDDTNGQLIRRTNYWETSLAQAGRFFFSVNAGCIRMLLPERQGGTTYPGSTREELDDSVLHSTKHVIVSRGKFAGQDAYEILFEDETNTPYTVHTSVGQWDRLIPASDSGRIVPFRIYRRGCILAREFEGRFRYVESLPCLKPWTTSSNKVADKKVYSLAQAAGLTGTTVSKPYPGKLPPDLAPFHIYVPDQGHCLIVVAAECGMPSDPTTCLVPYPVKAVLRVGYVLRDGLLWCNLPYDKFLGAIALPDEYEY